MSVRPGLELLQRNLTFFLGQCSGNGKRHLSHGPSITPPSHAYGALRYHMSPARKLRGFIIGLRGLDLYWLWDDRVQVLCRQITGWPGTTGGQRLGLPVTVEYSQLSNHSDVTDLQHFELLGSKMSRLAGVKSWMAHAKTAQWLGFLYTVTVSDRLYWTGAGGSFLVTHHKGKPGVGDGNAQQVNEGLQVREGDWTTYPATHTFRNTNTSGTETEERTRWSSHTNVFKVKVI